LEGCGSERSGVQRASVGAGFYQQAQKGPTLFEKETFDMPTILEEFGPGKRDSWTKNAEAASLVPVELAVELSEVPVEVGVFEQDARVGVVPLHQTVPQLITQATAVPLTTHLTQATGTQIGVSKRAVEMEGCRRLEAGAWVV
jgi:hypothetical protein